MRNMNQQYEIVMCESTQSLIINLKSTAGIICLWKATGRTCSPKLCIGYEWMNVFLTALSEVICINTLSLDLHKAWELVSSSDSSKVVTGSRSGKEKWGAPPVAILAPVGNGGQEGVGWDRSSTWPESRGPTAQGRLGSSRRTAWHSAKRHKRQTHLISHNLTFAFTHVYQHLFKLLLPTHVLWQWRNITV